MLSARTLKDHLQNCATRDILESFLGMVFQPQLQNLFMIAWTYFSLIY